jgi:small-conductance mechanosensitive channel
LNYEKILDTIVITITTPTLYWQSFTIISCFALSYFIYLILNIKIIPKIINSNKTSTDFIKLYKKYYSSLIFPITSLSLILISCIVYSQFFKENIMIITTLQLLTMFVFLRIIRISSNSLFIANSIGFIMVPAVLLHIFNSLDIAIFYLDEINFRIGKVKISLYLLIKAFIVLLLVFWISGVIIRKSKYYIDGNKNIKSSTKGIISKFIDILIYSIVVIVILKTFGVDLTTIAVIGGAVGVGIGFGLQKIASNFISGIILLFEKSVEVGDIVELDNGNIYGTIKHFGGRYTLVEANDGKEIMIPNEEFIINKVTNWTYSNNRARIEIKIGVTYESNLSLAKEIMLRSALSHKRCLTYPEPECYIISFNEYDVSILLYFWINDIVEGRMGAKSDIMIDIVDKFNENNIKIAIPLRELKFINNQ